MGIFSLNDIGKSRREKGAFFGYSTNMKYTLLDVEYKDIIGDESASHKIAEGVFLIIRIQIHNLGHSEQALVKNMIYLKSKGRTYNFDESNEFYLLSKKVDKQISGISLEEKHIINANKNRLCSIIYPDMKRISHIIFDVPRFSKKSSYKLLLSCFYNKGFAMFPRPTPCWYFDL